MKKIYLEPGWKMRREYNDLIQNPPQGYEFVVQETTAEGLFKYLAKTNLAYVILYGLDRFVPMELAKPYWERFKRLPERVDLTYSVFHPVFRKKPWIMDMQPEQPHLLVGSERVFRRWKGLMKGAFFSSYCRKIICQLEAAKKAFLEGVGWPELEEKTVVINLAVSKKHFTKSYDKDKIKLLFVNSANINASKHFRTHGGMILLEVFNRLCKKYDNLQLVVRSGLSQDIKEKFSQNPKVRIYDEIIPWPQLEEEFRSADIFLYPTFVTPATIFLDAMSYELPIVTTDVWGNSEIVEDGRTGLLVECPQAVKYTDSFIVHFDSQEYKKAISNVDPELVAAVTDKTSILIENEELRRTMGKAGRWEVEYGRFSIEKRNEKLKRVLDEATA
ncbi:glycosyltransferase family 4 protein [Chloroflexota bacterium]